MRESREQLPIAKFPDSKRPSRVGEPGDGRDTQVYNFQLLVMQELDQFESRAAGAN